jgi:hypothetical protein
MCYNAKLLSDQQLSAPTTWQDFAAINEDAVATISDASRGDVDVDESYDQAAPSAKRLELAYLLLAQAAAYTEPDKRPAFCFDAADMTPRVDGAPFMRAMQRLLSTLSFKGANLSDEDPQTTPLATRWIFSVLDGSNPIAVGWPPGAGKRTDSTPGLTLTGVPTWTADITWTELPSAQQFYDDASQIWRSGTTPAEPVTLLGPGGHLVGVTTSTKNTVSAFQLSQWFASPRVSRQLAGASVGSYPCRRSQVSEAASWLPSELPPGQADQIGRVAQTALSSDSVSQFPRIPGIDEYLAALHEGVLACRQGTEPAAALSAVAQTWDQITDARGRPQLLQSSRRHLEIEC